MRKIIYIILLFVYVLNLSAQTKTTISGQLATKKKITAIHLTNIDGVDINIPVRNSHFLFSSKSLTKCFYYLNEIGTIYLAPKYQLGITPNKSDGYVFAGIGALENNNFRKAKAQLPAFFPTQNSGGYGELGQDAYFLDVPVFEQKLDSFQKSGILLFNKSTDTLYQKYASQDLKFYCRHLLGQYTSFYGTDLQALSGMADSTLKLDRNAPDFMKKMMALMASTYKKQMNGSDRMRLYELSSGKFAMDDDTLFRNSSSYRDAFEDYFKSVSFSKYMTADDFKGKITDQNIRMLTVVNGEVKNPYILAYFEHRFTSDLMKQNKDTAVLNKYYNQYIAKATRQDYLTDIKNLYKIDTSYTDNTAAPPFTYKDALGKTVSLESLRGKYVYIDVWATWCGPCKGEIPHLKKLEEAYRDKNLQFVSISVDEQENLNKWKTFVKTEQLSGIQLITDNAFETPFITKMNINSIPRFILIDPVGKLISANALRPSDKELRTVLDKLPL